VLYPDPVLLAPTKPVEEVDDEIRQLVGDMVDTMYAAPGVGLAANQIGVPLRICIVDVTAGQEPGHLNVLINPKVIETEGAQFGEEGCLSFPEVSLDVERANRATIEATDLDGERFTITAEGFLARAMLHEIEHLDGEVFLRNVSPLKREMVKRRIKKRMKSGDWEPAVA
jgi:peptide deformylase